MQIKLYKQADENFGFFFQNKDEILDCSHLSKLTSFVKPSYKSLKEASRDARIIVRRHDYLLKDAGYFPEEDNNQDAAIGMEANSNKYSEEGVETMIVDSFINIYKNISQRLAGAASQMNETEKKEMKNSHKVLTIITSEIESICKTLQPDTEENKKIIYGLTEIHEKLFLPLFYKYFDGRKAEVNPKVMQEIHPKKEEGGGGGLGGLLGSRIGIYKVSNGQISKTDLEDDVKDEILETYSERVCLSVEPYHGDVYCKIHPNKLELFEAGTDDPILSVHINKDMVVTNIMPRGKIARLYPFYSVEFYQKYWKPIVESVHNFSIEGEDFVLFANDSDMSLPDAPNGNGTFQLSGWDTRRKFPKTLDISFRGKNPTMWLISGHKGSAKPREVPKYTEQSFLNAVVQCVDEDLSSLYGLVGKVIQVIPLVDGIEIDVDFIDNKDVNKDGKNIVRLSGDQVEILNNSQIENLKFIR